MTKEENKNLPDLTKTELFALVPLVIITVWLGVYPKPVLEPINNSVESVVELMHAKATTAEAKAKIADVKAIKLASAAVKEAE